MAIRFLVWISPLLVIPVSYLVFRIDAHRSRRYWSYIPVLLMAFLFNLLSVSFRVDLLDTLLSLFVLLIFCDFFWSLSRVRNRVISRIVFACAIVVFCLIYGGQILSGPMKTETLWKCAEDGEYKIKNAVYTVKEKKKLRFLNKRVRVFSLEKNVGLIPLEKHIRSWDVSEGYSRALFSFGWATTPNGVKLDLISGADTLWTLGEGF